VSNYRSQCYWGAQKNARIRNILSGQETGLGPRGVPSGPSSPLRLPHRSRANDVSTDDEPGRFEGKDSRIHCLGSRVSEMRMKHKHCGGENQTHRNIMEKTALYLISANIQCEQKKCDGGKMGWYLFHAISLYIIFKSNKF